MKGRREAPGGLISFLDVMCCGFGAVVLLVVILNGNLVQKRETQSEAMREEVRQLTQLESFARQELAQTGAELAGVEEQRASVSAQAARLEARLRDTRSRTQEVQARAEALQSSIATLQTQSAAVEQAVTLLRSKATQQWDGGRRPVGFSGDGQRQYLTGLKLGGERTLILLDSSASMLDETIVNVVRWRITEPAIKRTAPKWQRTTRTLHWLVANLRPGKQFQVYQFNASASPLLAGTEGKWLSTNDTASLTGALAAAAQIVPGGGTSLHRAYAVIAQMKPPPDSVVVLTDGLPTLGVREEPGRLVSAEERLTLFSDAIRLIPGSIPVNTILFPMEGDPAAAGAFWQLALMTQGSFMTPARDWP